MKYRRGAEIIIVIHDGKGWFDLSGISAYGTELRV